MKQIYCVSKGSTSNVSRRNWANQQPPRSVHGSANSIRVCCLFLNWQYNVTWAKQRKDALIFLFFYFKLYLNFWKYDFIIQTVFLDIFLSFLFSTKNENQNKRNNLVALFIFSFFQFFWQKWKNEKIT